MNKDGSCNISNVESVINQFQIENCIIINKSTVPPGTTEHLNKKFKKVQIIFNPEFFDRKGDTVQDFKNQNRIILGESRPTTTIVKNIFS